MRFGTSVGGTSYVRNFDWGIPTHFHCPLTTTLHNGKDYYKEEGFSMGFSGLRTKRRGMFLFNFEFSLYIRIHLLGLLDFV